MFVCSFGKTCEKAGGIDVFKTMKSAAREAARVATDGQTIAREGKAPFKVKWLGAPHLYLSGPLLVVYVGSEPAIMHVLSLALGPQFAGPVAPPGVGVR